MFCLSMFVLGFASGVFVMWLVYWWRRRHQAVRLVVPTGPVENQKKRRK